MDSLEQSYKGVNGLVYPEDGRKLFQGDFNKEQSNIGESILDREADRFSDGVLSGFDITVNAGSDGVVISGGIARDSNGLRIIVSVDAELSLEYLTPKKAIARHLWSGEEYTPDGDTESKTVRKNSGEIVLVDETYSLSENELFLYYLNRTETEVEITKLFHDSGLQGSRSFPTRIGHKFDSGSNCNICLRAGTAIFTENDLENGEVVHKFKANVSVGDIWTNEEWDSEYTVGPEQTDKSLLSKSEIKSELLDLIPVGTIISHMPGYFTDGANGGFNAVAMSLSEIWQLCDGSLYQDEDSPIFNGEGRYLPNISDSRFIMGSSVANAGVVGGANSVTLTTTELPAHTHGFSLSAGAAGDHQHYTGISADVTGFHLYGSTGAGGAAGHASYTGGSCYYQGYTSGSLSGNHTHSVSGSISSAGSGAAFGILPQYISAPFYIRVK